jgi:thiol-disulfide isomerase/thioredoxin
MLTGTRKEYDQMGRQAYESSKKGGRGSQQHRGGGFHNYQWYKKEFGLYDDDPQIETLNDKTFHVHDVSDSNVFVNFYSPGCSHCHDLAPAWRELGSMLQGIVVIAAINCQDSWGLCRQLGVRAYPTLMRLGVGTERLLYHGSRELNTLLQFVLELYGAPRTVVDLGELGAFPGSKLVLVAGTNGSPLTGTDLPLRLLVAALHGAVPVFEIDCTARPALCEGKDWEDNHARFVMTGDPDEVVAVGKQCFPTDGEEWDDVFSVQSLADTAISRLSLPPSIGLEQLLGSILPEQHDALRSHITGDTRKSQWLSINAAAACEANDEGVVRTGSIERAETVNVCMAECEAQKGCQAIDYFRDTKWW